MSIYSFAIDEQSRPRDERLLHDWPAMKKEIEKHRGEAVVCQRAARGDEIATSLLTMFESICDSLIMFVEIEMTYGHSEHTIPRLLRLKDAVKEKIHERLIAMNVLATAA